MTDAAITAQVNALPEKTDTQVILKQAMQLSGLGPHRFALDGGINPTQLRGYFRKDLRIGVDMLLHLLASQGLELAIYADDPASPQTPANGQDQQTHTQRFLVQAMALTGRNMGELVIAANMSESQAKSLVRQVCQGDEVKYDVLAHLLRANGLAFYMQPVVAQERAAAPQEPREKMSHRQRISEENRVLVR